MSFYEATDTTRSNLLATSVTDSRGDYLLPDILEQNTYYVVVSTGGLDIVLNEDVGNKSFSAIFQIGDDP